MIRRRRKSGKALSERVKRSHAGRSLSNNHKAKTKRGSKFILNKKMTMQTSPFEAVTTYKKKLRTRKIASFSNKIGKYLSINTNQFVDPTTRASVVEDKALFSHSKYSSLDPDGEKKLFYRSMMTMENSPSKAFNP